MATCGVETGFLFWKKACGAEAMGACRSCGFPVCMRHGAGCGDGTLLCTRCATDRDDSTGTVLNAGAIGLGAAAAASAAAADTEGAGAWHGEDSGGAEAGGGDGGGDGGGSSAD